MDRSVLRAMAKWPNVPAVYNWLALDRRGRWRLQGEVITHPGAVRFIGRNYHADDRGNWFFQNGPQRVFVTLEYTPWVLFVAADGTLSSHVEGGIHQVSEAILDNEGALILVTELGPGLVCDRDLALLSDCLRGPQGGLATEHELSGLFAESNETTVRFFWRGTPLEVRPLRRVDIPAMFGFNPDPVRDAVSAESGRAGQCDGSGG